MSELVEKKSNKGNLINIFKNLKNLTEKTKTTKTNSEKKRFSLYNVNVINDVQKILDSKEVKDEKTKRNSLEASPKPPNIKKPDSLPDSPRDFDHFQIEGLRTKKKHSLPSPNSMMEMEMGDRSGSISSIDNNKLTPPAEDSALSKNSYDENSSKGSLEDGSLKKSSLEELALLKKNSFEKSSFDETGILKKNISFDKLILEEIKEEDGETKKKSFRITSLKRKTKKPDVLDYKDMGISEQLVHCCSIGDVQHLNHLIKENSTDTAKFVQQTFRNQHPLLVASSHNHTEIMEILLNNGAFIDQTDSSERTSLHLAVSNGHKEAVITLLGRGATVNKRDQYSYSPFHLAIKQHYYTICNDLLLFGADVNFKRSDGTTVLHEIMLNNDLESLEFLSSLNNVKILVNQKDSQGEPPLFKGILRNKIEIVRYFCKYFKPKLGLTNDLGQNIFHVGAKSGVVEILVYIGAYELDLSLKNEMINASDDSKKKYKPIHYIVNSGNISILQKFLELGPDLNVKDNEGNTPLSLAKKREDEQMYKILKMNGAKLEKKGK